jgi:hypothetical protein
MKDADLPHQAEPASLSYVATSAGEMAASSF